MMNDILRDDMENICASDFIDWDMLKGKRILITGATGLIGFNLVNALAYSNAKRSLGLKVSAAVRDIDKARRMFAEIPDVSFVVSDAENMTDFDGEADYIVHGASPTASRYFVTHPAETIRTALSGTANILNIARAKHTAGVVYLSSMEAYGHVGDERLLIESDLGYIDPLNPRSSYPESKRMCEAMCAAYAHEYGVPAKTVRLVMTFGPGMSYDDKRVCAEFTRSIIEGRDIVLKTKGETKRCYLYTADAVTAILAVLLKGEAGQAYNAANPDTYCSVYEMAEMCARDISGGSIGVKLSLNDDVSMYPAPGYLMLDVSALKGCGWCPSVSLQDMYRRTIEYVRSLHAKI